MFSFCFLPAIIKKGTRPLGSSRVELRLKLMPRKAIEIDGLTKDYYTGFWRKRPHRALDRLDAEGGRRRSVRFSRAERRR